MFYRNCFVFFIVIVLSASCRNVRIKEHKNWEKYFDAYAVSGSFEIYDNNKEIAHYYNKELNAKPISPSSTFDIFVALTALETVTAKDEQKILEWDGVERENEKMNKNLSLSEAFEINSTSHIRKLIQEIGEEDIDKYLFTLQYGNQERKGDMENFWMNGNLKISPDEQVGLMKRLYHTELPQFNERSHRIVRGMLFKEEGDTYRLYYKMGMDTTVSPNRSILVGMVEQTISRKHVKTKQMENIPHPHFFALTAQGESLTPASYEEITLNLLWDLLDANNIGDKANFYKK